MKQPPESLDLDDVTLVFEDEDKTKHAQSLSDLTTVGTLVDEDGEELDLVDATITRSGDPDIPAMRAQLIRHLDDHYDDLHERERAHARTTIIFGLLYDDEDDEPDQAIRDALTDLMHEADRRDIDLNEALDAAVRMRSRERNDWGPTP